MLPSPTTPPLPPKHPLDLCTSSISSSSSPTNSPPPRPDSPRLSHTDATALARARLLQLSIWHDAAEDEREEPIPIRDISPPRDSDRSRPIDRTAGNTLPRRRSLFVAAPPARNGCPTVGWACVGAGRAGMERRKSIRRGKSFHRYARVRGDVDVTNLNSVRRRPISAPSEFDDLVQGLGATEVEEFDNLVDGLGATKVTETPVRVTSALPPRPPTF